MKIVNSNIRLEALLLTELSDLQDVEIRGDFYCRNNKGIKLTEEMIREVCNVKGEVYV